MPRPERGPVGPDSVDLTDSQLAAVKVEPVEERDFPVEKEAVGSIDFNEDMAVQVFTPYQGRIIALFAEVGDDVKKGQTLFTIDSPDLLQAESTLIAAAGVLELDQAKSGTVARTLYDARRVAARCRAGDFRPADRRRQSARGARRGAPVRQDRRRHRPHHRRSQRRSDAGRAEPDRRPDHRAQTRRRDCSCNRAIRRRRYTVANIDTMWMLANVAEDDSPAFRLGQQVQVKLDAFPGRVFDGKIATIGASVDPNTRRVLVRSEIKDPRHELRSGMFANFVIRRRAGAFPGNPARRRGARRRRHEDDLGHRRPPSVHPADGQDRRSPRRLPANSARRATGRTGRHRRRGVLEQRPRYKTSY